MATKTTITTLVEAHLVVVNAPALATTVNKKVIWRATVLRKATKAAVTIAVKLVTLLVIALTPLPTKAGAMLFQKQCLI